MLSNLLAFRSLLSGKQSGAGGATESWRSMPVIYQDYVLLSLLWIAYCCVHSALISVTATDFLQHALGDRYRFYRLLFNTFSVITLIPLLRYTDSARWQTESLFLWEGHLRIVQYFLITLAAILILTGARRYSILQFLGIQQILQRSGGAMTESGEVDSSGVLSVVRHPWYVAVFLLLWAKDLNLAGITVNLLLSGYLVIGTFLEERKLVLEFGDKYKAYQRRVSMFIPLKWLKSRLHG
jgi:methanethiol S-methyltransferase